MNPETGHVIVTEEGEPMPAGYWPVPPDMAKLFGLLPERKLETPTDFKAELAEALEASGRSELPSESEKAVTAEEDFAALRRKLEEMTAAKR